MKKLFTISAALLFAGAMFGQQASPNTAKYKGVSKDIKHLSVKATKVQSKRKVADSQNKAQKQNLVAPDKKATIKEKSTKETSGSK